MKSLTLLLLLFFISFKGISQVGEHNPDSLVVVTMNSGEIRIGKILNDDGREILLETKDIGKIFIRKENIKNIAPFKEEDFQNIHGELRAAGPFTTRYCFTTNAMPIKKGENYAMVNLYGPEVHFAVSNRLSLGIMSSWIGSPMVLAAKFTIPTKNEKLNFGLGTLAGTSGYLNTFKGFGGLHWGMVTYGDRLNNITFSAGFSYIKTGIKREYSEYAPGIFPAQQDQLNPSQYYFVGPTYVNYKQIVNPVSTAPVIGIGGIAKVGKKASFIFDAMVFFGKNNKTEFIQDYNNVYDPVTNQPAYTEVSEGKLVTTSESSTIAFFMPAMRFQKKDNSAFQVALAGVLVKTSSESKAFPIPMVSWFFKF